MPKRIINTLVFVGGDFSASMFEERDLCEVFGPLERDQIKAGPIGRFSYSKGQYEFWIAPDRIDIRCHDRTILPNEIIAVARKVAGELEPMRKAVPISAVGINCDAIFYSQEIDREGSEFCRALTETPLSQHLLTEQRESLSVVTFTFPSDTVQYNIRLEPERGSRGRDLFVAINGHQDVTSGDRLEGKLEVVDEVGKQVRHFHHQITSSKGK